MSGKQAPPANAPTALSNATLGKLPRSVSTPSYPRASVKEGIVHVGVGGFHRAHEALYVDDLLRMGERDWGIAGLGIRNFDKKMHDVLRAQDSLFTVVEREGDKATARVVGSHTRSLLAPENPEVAIEALAAPSTRIVSLTITEAGYYVDDLTGAFRADHPDIAADVASKGAPQTAHGYIVAALALRHARGQGPFTVMSCDNLELNGKLTRRAMTGFAELVDPKLATWLNEHGAFPSCMVDRITPATTDADRDFVREKFQIDDAWPVVCEPFRQWVIEDAFVAGRPAFERVGAQLVHDVEPYERMKLGLLNASHSAMAYLGHLAGYTFVHDVMRDPSFLRYLDGFMAKEVSPILPPVPGVDLADYRSTLIHRFSNVAIADRISRLVQNGSAKLPKFTLGSLRAELAKGGPIRRLTLAVAGWCRYLTGIDEKGNAYELDDTMTAELQPIAREGKADPTKLLAVQSVFGPDLGQNERFVSEMKRAKKSLCERGAQATVAACVESEG